jgi:hypothetical protein
LIERLLSSTTDQIGEEWVTRFPATLGGVMNPRNDRQELQRRLEQARRIVSQITDLQTIKNLNRMIADIEEDIRKADGSPKV